MPSRRQNPRQGWANCKPTTESSTGMGQWPAKGRFADFGTRFRKIPRGFDLPWIGHVVVTSRPEALSKLSGGMWCVCLIYVPISVLDVLVGVLWLLVVVFYCVSQRAAVVVSMFCFFVPYCSRFVLFRSLCLCWSCLCC